MLLQHEKCFQAVLSRKLFVPPMPVSELLLVTKSMRVQLYGCLAAAGLNVNVETWAANCVNKAVQENRETFFSFFEVIVQNLTA